MQQECVSASGSFLVTQLHRVECQSAAGHGGPRGAQNGPATLKFSACLHLPPFCAQMGIGFYDLLAIARLQTAGG